MLLAQTTTMRACDSAALRLNRRVQDCPAYNPLSLTRDNELRIIRDFISALCKERIIPISTPFCPMFTGFPSLKRLAGMFVRKAFQWEEIVAMQELLPDSLFEWLGSLAPVPRRK